MKKVNIAFLMVAIASLLINPNFITVLLVVLGLLNMAINRDK